MLGSSSLWLGLIALLMGYWLLDLGLGDHYVCPGCGATHEDDHDDGCPWRR